RVRRDRARAVALDRLRALLEVPRQVAPLLHAVVDRRPADPVHHQDVDAAGLVGRQRRVLAPGRHLLGRLRLAHEVAHVVAQLVHREVVRRPARAGLQPDDLRPALGQRERGVAAGRAEPDDHHVLLLQPRAHATASFLALANWPPAYVDLCAFGTWAPICWYFAGTGMRTPG